VSILCVESNNIKNRRDGRTNEDRGKLNNMTNERYGEETRKTETNEKERII
jgi:hypothetical protein